MYSTCYNITYDVEKNGETAVEQKVTIVNKENDVLATTYTHTLKHLNIYDVYGEDTKGALEINIKSTQDTTTLKTELNEQVIGKNRANELLFRYKTKDIANKVGEIWNINLPQVTTTETVKEYDITLKVPEDFGPEIFIAPQPNMKNVENTKIIYKFNKENIDNAGITAAFGKYQLLNYQLKYHLQNTSWLPTTQEIALPPDIANTQQINFNKLTPQPQKVYRDKDGNIMAAYKVPAKKDLEIALVGSAKILGTQIHPEFGGKIHEIPQKLIDTYTQPQTYWEANSAEIQALAKELFDPKSTVAQNAQTIYNYITSEAQYNFETTKETFITRKGAQEALNQKETWACMEFTDLFIALARAMGIPSRELNGYAFANAENLAPLSINLKSGDLLHAWPEFYDPNFGWVAIDPTWGNTSGIDYFTKLDTNHFAFAIKGLNSEYPLPAGAYKVQDTEKQVEVSFAQDQIIFAENIVLHKKTTLNPLKVLKRQQKYKIQSLGGITLYNINNTSMALLPFESEIIYLPKGAKPTITFNDLLGNTIIQEIPVKNRSIKTAVAEKLIVACISILGGVLVISINKKRRKTRGKKLGLTTIRAA